MVSTTDLCKRALVTLLHALAQAYGCAINVTRDSPDAVVKRAYRTVSVKTHPDHGGSTADQQRLNGAYESWCQASREKGGRGRPSEKAGPKDSTLRVPTQARPGDVPKSYQFWSQAVLLTYQGFQKYSQTGGQTDRQTDRQT